MLLPLSSPPTMIISSTFDDTLREEFSEQVSLRSRPTWLNQDSNHPIDRNRHEMSIVANTPHSPAGTHVDDDRAIVGSYPKSALGANARPYESEKFILILIRRPTRDYLNIRFRDWSLPALRWMQQL
ncbi:hypothetical protein FRB93_006563 [Tulasnella sp. JGI-2019a]|nr:hypothetical protein FRB93_006563 [Tulasnella sp. JGI-2019a]